MITILNRNLLKILNEIVRLVSQSVVLDIPVCWLKYKPPDDDEVHEIARVTHLGKRSPQAPG